MLNSILEEYARSESDQTLERFDSVFSDALKECSTRDFWDINPDNIETFYFLLIFTHLESLKKI